MQTLSLYVYLVRLQLRTRLQYRANLVIGWVAQAFGYASVYGTIWIIASRFERLGGWVWPEIALMLGFSPTDRLQHFSYPMLAQMLVAALVLGAWFDRAAAAVLYWRDRRAAAA